MLIAMVEPVVKTISSSCLGAEEALHNAAGRLVALGATLER